MKNCKLFTSIFWGGAGTVALDEQRGRLSTCGRTIVDAGGDAGLTPARGNETALEGNALHGRLMGL